MWTRRILKARAKAVLRTSYWKAFLVSLILGFAGGQAGGGVNISLPFGGGGNTGNNGWSSSGTSGFGGGVDFTALIIAIALIIGLIVLVFVLAFRIFLGFPLEVGTRQYFKQASQDDANLNYLGHVFNKRSYWPVVQAMLLRGVYTVLWTLLLIIPGIIKSYSYSMVPYLLAENPQLGAIRAIELSRNMAEGHKWRMFVLDLSFIGWYLLGTLALFVGILFVLPYVNQTKAELYLALRREALDRGLTSAEELRLS